MKNIDTSILELQNLASNPIWVEMFSMLPPIDSALQKIGANGFSVLRQVYNDPFVFGAINSRKSGVLLSDWNIRGDGSEEVLAWLTKLDVLGLIEKVLDVIYFGFQVFEINWNENYEPVEVKQCYPELFRLKDNELLYIGDGREKSFPKQKFIWLAFGQNLYEIYGSALLSKVYYYWLFLKEATKHWVRYVEKFGIPVTDVKMIGSEEEQQRVARALREAVANSIIVHDPNFEVSYLDVTQKDGAIFTNLIEHCKNAISVAILGHERGMQSTSGKLGNEQLAISVREDLIRQDKRLVEKFFDTLIKYYWEFHHDTEQPYFYFVEDEDLQMDRAKRDQILAQIGVVFSPDYWKKQYNLGDEDVMFEQDIPSSVKRSDELIETAIKSDPVGFNTWAKQAMKYLSQTGDYKSALNGLQQLFGNLTEREVLDRMEKLMVLAFSEGFDANQSE